MLLEVGSPPVEQPDKTIVEVRNTLESMTPDSDMLLRRYNDKKLISSISATISSCDIIALNVRKQKGTY